MERLCSSCWRRGGHLHLLVVLLLLQRWRGLSKTFGHSHCPKKQPLSVKNPARGCFTKCSKTYLGNYSPLCNQLPGDNEVYRGKREPFAGSWVGWGAPSKIPQGQSHLELFSFLSALNVKQFKLEGTTSTNEQGSGPESQDLCIIFSPFFFPLPFPHGPHAQICCLGSEDRTLL